MATAGNALWASAASQGSRASIGNSPNSTAAIGGAIRDRRRNIRLTRNHSRSCGTARPLHHVPQALGERRRLGTAVLEHDGYGERRQRHQPRGADADQYLRFADADQRDAISRADAELIDDGNLPRAPGTRQFEPLQRPADGQNQRHDGDETQGELRQAAHGQRRGGLCQPRHRACSILSVALTTSVNRMPNFSLTTTTSPRAMRTPFTSTSRGSPARRSSSTTAPGASCNRSRTAMRARPTSSASVTATSRIRFRFISWPPAPAAFGPKSPNCARATAAFFGSGVLMWGLLEVF